MPNGLVLSSTLGCAGSSSWRAVLHGPDTTNRQVNTRYTTITITSQALKVFKQVVERSPRNQPERRNRAEQHALGHRRPRSTPGWTMRLREPPGCQHRVLPEAYHALTPSRHIPGVVAA